MRDETLHLCLPRSDQSDDRKGGAASEAEMRCCCGNLLARLVSGSLEVKCRRCKRTVVLKLEVDSPGQ